MNGRFVLIVLAALTLTATGCKKKDHPAGGSEDEPTTKAFSITGAPESAVLVGEKFSLTVESLFDEVDARTAVWSSSNTNVAKVNASGRVLATGKGKCNIVAKVGKVSRTVSVSVNDRNPAKDEMGHTENSKTDRGQNNNSVTFNVFDTGWKGEIWYQGGNNSMTYYDNGTFKASWSATNDCIMRVGYYYGKDSEVDPDDMQYDCYFRHTKTGSGGGYNYIGLYGWTVNPLVEFYIVDDWYNMPGANLLGQKKGEFTVDGAKYEIYQNLRVQQPSIADMQTFPQFFSVRTTARQSGHIDASAHFKKFKELGMNMGKMYELRYFFEVGGGTGTLDCTYLFLSDGKI